ncbi:MAG: hypothetical protein LC808_30810 [Actinobacteria bacterium]|nr:hypothetical protein [Actinomycetota bacterium]
MNAIVVSVTFDRLLRSVLAPSSPGWRFYLLLLAPALGILYASSFPGHAYFIAMACGYLLVGAAVVWAVRLGGFLSSEHRRTLAAQCGLQWRRSVQRSLPDFFGLTLRSE